MIKLWQKQLVGKEAFILAHDSKPWSAIVGKSGQQELEIAVIAYPDPQLEGSEWEMKVTARPPFLFTQSRIPPTGGVFPPPLMQLRYPPPPVISWGPSQVIPNSAKGISNTKHHKILLHPWYKTQKGWVRPKDGWDLTLYSRRCVEGELYSQRPIAIRGSSNWSCLTFKGLLFADQSKDFMNKVTEVQRETSISSVSLGHRLWRRRTEDMWGK